MSLEPGTRLGTYEIQGPLSDVGGGKTYKASDTARSRTVIVRLLGPDAAGNPDEVSRLGSDIQALASLSHPSIGQVYDLVEHDESRYLVTEYLEGETLAQRLARGRLDLAEALDIAIPMADALDQAHRTGVVHRSLNPSSVMLSPDGVKLVDFGLSASGEAGDGAASVSMASTRSIGPQSAMSEAPETMRYQAPEQLDGGEADARSDIFAFGGILYEMLTGRPAFEGKTRALVAAAIASLDPDPVSSLQPMAPPALDYLVGRCLVRDSRKRLQTARDLLSQLRWIAGEGAEGGLAASLEARRKRERRIRIGLAAALVLALGLAPLAYWSMDRSEQPSEARFIVNDVGFVNVSGQAATPTLSPNGRWLASTRGFTDGLDVLSLDSVTSQIVLYGHAVYHQFWNPNNEQVAFWEDGFLKKARVSGGEPTNIVEVPPPFGAGAWSPDGVIVYSSQGRLYRVLDTGGDAVQITTLDESRQETEHLAPVFLPDGRHFLFLALSSQPENSGIYVASLDSPDRTWLFATESRPWFSEPGYILFNRGDVIYAQAFDTGGLTIEGEPYRIADGVLPGAPSLAGELSSSFTQSATYSVSRTGVLAYRMGATPGDGPAATGGNAETKSLVWFGRSGAFSPLGETGSYAGIDLAPDGRRFAVHRHDGTGGDIWIYDPDQGGMRRWTFDITQENSSPVWSPDSDRIAFASRRNGRWGIWVKAADGTGSETMIVEQDAPLAPMSWAPNGEIVYWIAGAATQGDIWAVSAEGNGTPRAVFEAPADEAFPQVSPDGNWIAYQKRDDAGNWQIWVDSFPEPQGNRGQITNGGGQWPRWRADGQDLELYFADAPSMMAVRLRVVGAAIQPDGVPRALFPLDVPNLRGSSHYNAASSYIRYAVAADGQRFLIPQPAPAGGAVPSGGAAPIAETLRNNVDGPGQGAPLANEIAVVLDWTRLLPEN